MAPAAGADRPIHPTSYDAIIVGTGLPESLVAASLAIAGKTVLHVDCGDSYGSHWASLTMDSLQQWAKQGGAIPAREEKSSEIFGFVDEEEAEAVGDRDKAGDGEASRNSIEESGETVEKENDRPNQAGREDPENEVEEALSKKELVEMPLTSSVDGSILYSDVAVHDWSGSEGSDSTSLGNLRGYSIDVCGPRVVHCAEALVDVMIRSATHHYVEFKAMDAMLMWQPSTSGASGPNGPVANEEASRLDNSTNSTVTLASGVTVASGAWTRVPMSRSDVFQDSTLSLVEKRLLMRFFKVVADFAAQQQQAEQQRREESEGGGKEVDTSDSSRDSFLYTPQFVGGGGGERSEEVGREFEGQSLLQLLQSHKLPLRVQQ